MSRRKLQFRRALGGVDQQFNKDVAKGPNNPRSVTLQAGGDVMRILPTRTAGTKPLSDRKRKLWQEWAK